LRTLILTSSVCGCRSDNCVDERLPATEESVRQTLLDFCETEAFENVTNCTCRGATKSAEMCVALVDNWLASVRTADLSYQSNCVDTMICAHADFVLNNTDRCSSDRDEQLSWLTCQDECQIYAGSATEGEACERLGRRMSTCAANLACGSDDRCHRPCDLPLEIPEGGPCGIREGLIHEQCTAGTVCIGDPGVCVRSAPSGSVCDPAMATCAPTDACFEATAICEPRLAEGDPCTRHEECASEVCVEVCLPPDPFRCGNFWH